jgi:hypothetical protein
MRLGKAKRRQSRDLRDALLAAGPKPTYANVFTTEQAADVARAILAWHRRRTRITETWRKRSRLSDPELVQERHSPTVEIAVDDPEAKRRVRRNITRVRQSEAWRHNNLDTMQRQAEAEMHSAWRLRTGGLQIRGQRLDLGAAGRPSAIERDTAIMLKLDATWREWIVEAKARGIDRRVIIMVLSEPRTLSEVERACRLPRGAAIEIYRRGLDLWCELRGWLRPAIAGCGQLPA